MILNRLKTLLLAFVGGSAVFLFLWLGLRNSGTVTAASANTLNRPEDPVVVAGADLAVFDGEPIDELRLYTFDGSDWSPVPFQIDERLNDITGTYVISEDGLLDANDELVFMAKDAGVEAGTGDWPSDTMALANPRVEVAAGDPLSPGDMGWAYLFRSTTLATDPAIYVDWDFAMQTVTALSYTAAFTEDFIGLADITVNGSSTDILDRQKTRVDTAILDLDEESLALIVNPTITIPVVGPVRGVANGGQFNISIYGARLDSAVSFDTSISPFPVQSVRNSLDLNDPTLTGITNYFNSNGVSVTIDGVNDAVGATPRVDWFQTSGVSGGMVVAFPTVSAGGGTVTNYYEDDSAVNPNDTGDQRSYGDSGLFIANPGGVIDFSLVTFILPPNTTTSVGDDYFDRISNPLTATTTTQEFGETVDVYLPVVLKP